MSRLVLLPTLLLIAIMTLTACDERDLHVYKRSILKEHSWGRIQRVDLKDLKGEFQLLGFSDLPRGLYEITENSAAPKAGSKYEAGVSGAFRMDDRLFFEFKTKISRWGTRFSLMEVRFTEDRILLEAQEFDIQQLMEQKFTFRRARDPGFIAERKPILEVQNEAGQAPWLIGSMKKGEYGARYEMRPVDWQQNDKLRAFITDLGIKIHKNVPVNVADCTNSLRESGVIVEL